MNEFSSRREFLRTATLTGAGLALTGVSADGTRVLRTVYDMFTRKVVAPTCVTFGEMHRSTCSTLA